MKKHIFLLLLLMMAAPPIVAQDCGLANSFKTLEGNNISARIPANGNLFWNSFNDHQFEITNNYNLPFASTFLSGGIWVAGKNENDELKLAASRLNTNTRQDFFAGPIFNDNGQLSFDCENYNRLWEVIGQEILQHLSDFQDNGIIDDPIPNIYGYPGKANPHFESIHGFPLPDSPQGLAPFLTKTMTGFIIQKTVIFLCLTELHQVKFPHKLSGVFLMMVQEFILKLVVYL